MQMDDVFGNRKGDTGATDLDRMHIAVDPYGRAHLVWVVAEGQQRNIASFGRLTQYRQSNKRRVLLCPLRELIPQLGVVDVGGAKHVCLS